MKDQEGKSFRAIARELGISWQAVQQIYYSKRWRANADMMPPRKKK